MFIPSLLLKQLYTFGSLHNTANGISFQVKNRLSDTEVQQIHGISINGKAADLSHVMIETGDGKTLKPVDLSKENPVDLPLRATMRVMVSMPPLPIGKHNIEIVFEAKTFGKLKLNVEDGLSEEVVSELKIPRNDQDDYEEGIIKTRQAFLEKASNISLEHIKHYSFDPHILQGNIEHFTGVAQIPLGISGPIRVNGEFAQGDFLVPMATTEGTLVASYNRGIKVLNECGGVKTTVVQDAMQRAPVFVFEDARGARHFVSWVLENEKTIAEKAEETTRIGKLKDIDFYLSNKFAFLRFNYSTGDAAGQNMVGRATFAACSWILDAYKDHKVTNFYLESNFATDKKASQVNIMRTRGKRVTAECVLKREVLNRIMRVEPEQLAYHSLVSNVGSILSGANNNGAHSANAITAIFIATGQDVANVAESSAAILFSEVTKEGDLYISITIPSLIIATYGGGTGLSTQRECLEIMGCYGKGGVMKLAEIIAGVVLAGEISLASAISSSDWVSSHEQYGRNR